MTAVVAMHCDLLTVGWTGVWLFFVISGYVVTLSVISRPQEERLAGLARFFRRRCLRIFPIYYAYVAAGFLVALVLGQEIYPAVTASLLGFVYNVARAAGAPLSPDWPVAHLWSLSAEMQFYLLFGVALFFLPRRILVVLLFATLLVAPLLRFAVSAELTTLGWGHEAIAFAVYVAPFLHNNSFAVGALLAFASHHRFLDRIAWPLALAGVAVLCAYCIIYVHIGRTVLGTTGIDSFRNIVSGILYGQHREVFVYSSLAIAFAGVVALAATGRSRVVNWFLGYPALQRIGEISYGAYVLHLLVITIVLDAFVAITGIPFPKHSVGARIALFVVAYGLTIAGAELSYRYFETRFTTRRRTGKTLVPDLAMSTQVSDPEMRKPVSGKAVPAE